MNIMRNIALVILMLAGPQAAMCVFAQNVNLQAEHGPNLDKAPFVMRYKFAEQYGIDWSDSTYDQREAFLDKWYADAAAQAEQDEQTREQEAQKKEDDLEAQQNEKERYREKLSAQADKEEAEAEAEADEKQAFQEQVQERKDRIEQLRSSDKQE